MDFENDRFGQGRNHSPDKLFSSPSGKSPRISVADQGGQHYAIKRVDNHRICLTKIIVDKICWDQKKKNATSLQRLQKYFHRLPKNSTVRCKRISRYRSARGQWARQLSQCTRPLQLWQRNWIGMIGTRRLAVAPAAAPPPPRIRKATGYKIITRCSSSE